MEKRLVISLFISVIKRNQLVDEILSQINKNDFFFICFANSHMIIEAKYNPETLEKLNKARYILADGVPAKIALKLLYSTNQERIAGMDFMPLLINHAANECIPIFFYGSTQNVLNKIIEKAINDHPNIIIAGYYSPPFHTMSEKEKEYEIELINKSGAKIVFVALGCPKQELWMAENSKKINAILLGVGGAFPVYAGLQNRAPKWIRVVSLEWLFRLFQEPKRLFKRYLITNTLFIYQIMKELIKVRLLKTK